MNSFGALRSGKRSASGLLVFALAGLLSFAGCEIASFRTEKRPDGLTLAQRRCLKAGNCGLDYATVHEIVIRSKCLSCHDGPDSPHGIDLSSYEGIMSQELFPPLVVPGKPERSSLFKSVKNDEMPIRRKPLSREMKKLLFDWISVGAPRFAMPPGHDHSPGDGGGEPGSGEPDEPSDPDEPADPDEPLDPDEPADPDEPLDPDEPND